jgi:hypothetical protein
MITILKTYLLIANLNNFMIFIKKSLDLFRINDIIFIYISVYF